ncbi:MAG: hypothetical protein ACLU8D_08805 [Enterocloster sp.]
MPCRNTAVLAQCGAGTDRAAGLSERFTMEGYRSGKSFRLLNRNVHEAAVWALEPRILERRRQKGSGRKDG